jgi:hypothetical protein
VATGKATDVDGGGAGAGAGAGNVDDVAGALARAGADPGAEPVTASGSEADAGTAVPRPIPTAGLVVPPAEIAGAGTFPDESCTAADSAAVGSFDDGRESEGGAGGNGRRSAAASITRSDADRVRT